MNVFTRQTFVLNEIRNAPMKATKYLAAAFSILLICDAQAANLPKFATPDHLLPLDGRGIGLYQGFWEFLKVVAPRDDDARSSIYVWPSFKPGVFIAIYQTSDEKSYYLLYALDTKPKPTVTTMSVSDTFAKGVSDKLENIIRTGTRYPSPAEGLSPIECTDGTEYVFESHDLYGTASCPAAGVALQLERVAQELIDLADESSASHKSQNEKMAEILSVLDAANHE